MDEPFEPVEGIDCQRAEGVLFIQECIELVKDRLNRGAERELGAVDLAEPILGLNEDCLRGTGGEGRLANALLPVNNQTRRQGRAPGLDGRE